MYKPYIVKECIENFLECNFSTGQLEQHLSQPTLCRHLNLLPKNLIQTIIRLKFRTKHYYDMEEYVYKLANRSDYKELIGESVNSIVRRTSTTQSIKGAFTAGLLKSFNYSARKLTKMMK